MRHLPAVFFVTLSLMSLAALTEGVAAQQTPALIPSLGGGIARQGGEFTPTLNAILEVDIHGERWHWLPYLSARGIPVTCSEECASDGWGAGLGMLKPLGDVWVGGGLGFVGGGDDVQVQPFAQCAVDRRRFRFQLRVELMNLDDGIYVPVLIGLRLP
ncbi:MAG: hypothetical protein JXA57_10135 [Armatimonadetes bacterium]|nr:hypothetical protein [Armatimonadota bacterium]